MSRSNRSRHSTAFTVSIEAREGVSTGISAHDRAHTISVAIDPTKDYRDVITPGHVFPLVAKDGGVLIRAGHTEAAVDIARLAGLYPAGVICEIMNDDGNMARLPDLIAFAQRHGLKIGTITDLIAYRLRYDHLVRVVAETKIDSAYGGAFDLKVYATTVDPAEHVALVKGDVASGGPVLVRVHALNTIDDVLSTGTSRETPIHKAIGIIGREGRGVVVLIRRVAPRCNLCAAQAGGRWPGPAAADRIRHRCPDPARPRRARDDPPHQLAHAQDRRPRRLWPEGRRPSRPGANTMTRKGPRSVLIIEARFYEDIADELARGAIDELDAQHVAYERLAVPGSLEIALALSLALANGFVGRAGRHRGCIALGCVIRGETTHYDIVARESAASLHQLAVQHAVPIGFGILTCESREQAWERASVDGRNKGSDAARACLTLMQLEQHFSSASRR